MILLSRGLLKILRKIEILASGLRWHYGGDVFAGDGVENCHFFLLDIPAVPQLCWNLCWSLQWPRHLDVCVAEKSLLCYPSRHAYGMASANVLFRNRPASSSFKWSRGGDTSRRTFSSLYSVVTKPEGAAHRCRSLSHARCGKSEFGSNCIHMILSYI